MLRLTLGQDRDTSIRRPRARLVDLMKSLQYLKIISNSTIAKTRLALRLKLTKRSLNMTSP